MTPDVVELTKHSRIVITPDPAPSNPREEERICGCYTPPWAAVYGMAEQGPPPLHDYPGDISRAAEHLEYEVLQQWAALFHGIAIEKIGSTYWYCDRNAFSHMHGGEFTLDTQREIIEAEVAEWRSFIEGKARVLTFQRLAQFRRVTAKFHEKQEDLLEVWENVEFIGDLYLEDEFTPAHVAHEFFWDKLTRKEKTIISAMIDVHNAERALPNG